jgi:myo-inositol-1-phosphate synthase
MMMKSQITPAEGKLGIMVVGINGAVATTFISGVISVRKKLSLPIGSLTQMATIRIGERIENKFPLIKEFVPLADLNDIVFSGWDIRDENLFDAATGNGVLKESDLLPLKEELQALRPMKAVFDNKFVTRLHGDHVKTGATKYELAQSLREDIKNFKAKNEIDRVVIIWCGSTEVYLQPYNSVYSSMDSFEEGLKNNSPAIAPSMIYAYAALKEGIPYINGAPGLTVDIPAFTQ